MRCQTIALQRGAERLSACFAWVPRADVEQARNPADTFLSAAEFSQYAALQFAPKQQAFLLGRFAAKSALCMLVGENDLRHVDIYAGAFGQPMIGTPLSGHRLVTQPAATHSVASALPGLVSADPAPGPVTGNPATRGALLNVLDVTVSHSQDLAVALAFPAAWPMGIDVEAVPAAAAATVLDALDMSDFERRWLLEQSLGREAACGLYWAAREALGKSMKIGLNCPLRVLSINQLAPVGTAAWIATYSNFPQSRCLLQIADGRVLAVALPGDVTVTPWPAWP